MKGALLFAVLFMCLVNRHSSLEPPDQEYRHSSVEPQDQIPKKENETIIKINTDISELAEMDVQESVLSEISTLLTATQPTEEVSMTSELSVQDITPTVAPATPSYDVESNMPVLYSVLHDVNPEHAAEDPSDVVQLPTSLKSSLDSSPSVSVEPAPNPDPTDTSDAKVEESSIAAGLKQADKESKTTEDEMPSFDEFKRQMLKEEEEKIKQQNIQDVAGIPAKPKVKKAKKRKQTNYASVDCGAKVLDVNSEASNAEAILTENRDIYMLNPCSVKIFFVVELCDTAHVKSIDIANFELFSSMPESFHVFVSSRYPTREWNMLGTFQARDQRDIQSFPLDEPIYAKYLKVEMLSHFGSEHYCPLSLLRVYGISMMEELEDQEVDGQDEGEVTEGETEEEEVIQILPEDPSAKEDELNKKGILEQAADTVMNLVKKFVGGDGTTNGSSNETEVKMKHSIVTLIERDDVEEKVTDVNRTSLATSEPHKMPATSSDEKNHSKVLQPSTAALTPCEVFIKHLGHSSFGCFNGSIFFCNKYENLTITTQPKRDINGQSGIAKQKDPIVRKLDDEEDKLSTKRVRTKESKSVRLYCKWKRYVNNKILLRISAKRVKAAASVKSVAEKDELALDQHTEEHVEQSRTSTTVTTSVESAAQPSTPKTSSSQGSSSVEHSTASVHLPAATSVTTKPLPDNSIAPSMPTHSDEASFVEPIGEKSADLLKNTDQKPVIEVSSYDEAKPLEEKYPESSSSEDTTVSSVSYQDEELIDESSSVTAVSEASTSGNVQSSVHNNGKSAEEADVATLGALTAAAAQSKCKAVNSIEMIDQNSPHVDILEIKLTDSSGKEGTAQLHQPDNSNSSVTDKAGMQQQAAEEADDAPPAVVSEQLHETSKSEQQEERSENKKTDNKEAENPTDSSIVSSALSESGSFLESEPPRAAPPVVSQEAGASPPPSVCSTGSAAHVEVSSADVSSKVAHQGMGSGQKESIFMRLSNRIKALEQNLTLSTLYMEQINQRYRKNLDELQKNFDKKMVLLSNATKKAEVVINGQKEQISQLQEQLEKTSAVVSEIKQRMRSLNEEVMERHVIGLVMEVLLIILLMFMFRHCDRQRATLPLTGGAPPILNGSGPPRLLHKEYHHGDVMAEKNKGEVREQSDPENITRTVPVQAGAEHRRKDSTGAGESKKKKHKRRSKCLETAPASAVATEASPQTPPSVITHTAGLLFSSARGILDSWRVRKPTTCQSEPNMSTASNTTANTKRTALIRAKSFDAVPERVNRGQAPPSPPPPPPPPYTPRHGWANNVPTPPPLNCSETRRHPGSYGVQSSNKTGAQQHSFVFSSKYVKQVKVGSNPGRQAGKYV